MSGDLTHCPEESEEKLFSKGCRYCGKKCNPSVTISETTAKLDMRLSGEACMECAIKRGIFCTKHNQAHLAFEGGCGHACYICLGEIRVILMNNRQLIEEVLRANRANPAVQSLMIMAEDEGSDFEILFFTSGCGLYGVDPNDFVQLLKDVLSNKKALPERFFPLP